MESAGGKEDINIGIGELDAIGLAFDLNRAAAPLLQASINGNSIGDVEIHLVELEPEVLTFGIIKLERAFVQSFTTEGPEDERPWFQAFLVYDRIEVTNRFVDPNRPGTLETRTTWDLVTNTGTYRDGGIANLPPQLSPIGAVTIPEDSTRTLSFTVGDPDGPAANLTTTGTSSNFALLPKRRIQTGGDGRSRTVTFAPLPNRHGKTTVTVVASDSVDSASTSFEVTVTPTPDPPAIAEIDPQILEEDTSATIPISPSDPDQSSETLALVGTSSNQALLPDRNITFAFDEGSWQMTLTPVAGQAGSADVTVVVTDDTGDRASTTFLLTVNGTGNSAPTDITLTPALVAENSPGGTPVGLLEAVDPDGDPGITFTLAGSAGDRFRLVNGNRIVTTPSATFDFESSPFHTIFVRATDPAGAVFAKAVRVQVDNVNEAPKVTIDLPPTLPAAPPEGASPIPIPYPNISLSDPDSGAFPVEVTFSVIHGILHVDDSTTLFGRVPENHASTVRIVAPVVDIILILRQGGFTYAPEPGYVGAESLEITIDDLGSSGTGGALLDNATEAFFVRPEPVRAWIDEFYTPEEQADPEFDPILGDTDRDRLAGILEFKLGKNPRDSSDAGTGIEIREEPVADEVHVHLSFDQRTDASTPNTELTVEVSDALSGWQSGSDVITLVSRTPLADNMERLVYRLTRSVAEQPVQFLRFSAHYAGFQAPR